MEEWKHRQAGGLFAGPGEPFLAEKVAVVGDELRVEQMQAHSGPKDMVLVDALLDLVVPHATTAKIAFLETTSLDLRFVGQDGFDFFQIKGVASDVGISQVGHRSHRWRTQPIPALDDAVGDLGNLLKQADFFRQQQSIGAEAFNQMGELLSDQADFALAILDGQLPPISGNRTLAILREAETATR